MHPHLLLDATTDKRKKRTVVYAAEPPVSLKVSVFALLYW